MANLVSVLITTYDSAGVLRECLQSVFAQDYPALEVIIIDNNSADGTRAILDHWKERARVVYNSQNTGFAAAQNQAMAQARGDWFLCLNPDAILDHRFISELVLAVEADPRAGTVCGKLLRWDPDAKEPRTSVIDSTGIYFLPNLRHLDRGSEEPDRRQYDQREYVFGATGAAAMYRKTMVEDISINGQLFDEDFFVYREDADVAWRAQLMGWRCLYTPAAVGWHVRRVTPERVRQLPDFINRHSIKNRFLMRAKDLSAGLYARLFIPITARDLMILGYCLLRNPPLLGGLGLLWKNRASIRNKRKWIQSRRRVGDEEIRNWFYRKSKLVP